MKKIIWLLLLSALLWSVVGTPFAARAQVPALPADEVVVRPVAGVPITTITSRYAAQVFDVMPENNVYFLKLLNGQSAASLLPILQADPDLVYAEPNYYADTLEQEKKNIDAVFLEMSKRNIDAVKRNIDAVKRNIDAVSEWLDVYGEQWAWERIGLADAQKISRGQGVIVATLDTGLTPDHPLLNSSLTAGYNFVGMNTDIYDRGNGLDDDGDGEIDEGVGHGTHIAGIIVTIAPGVQIMPIRVLNSDGVGTYSEVAAGIRYAVDHGARVINMSLSAPLLPDLLAEAVSYANAHGVIVVASVGEGEGPNYPAAIADPLAVLGVGATAPDETIASFSGGAAFTDVYAPGVLIYSAYPYQEYVFGTGTSMAAAIVSAEAALLLSRYPDWTPLQVKQRILSQVSPLANATAGRVDLAAALTTGFELRYRVGDTLTPQDAHIKPQLKIVNNTPWDIPLSEFQIRYWYTVDGEIAQNFWCDYAWIGCGKVQGQFVPLPVGHANRTSLSDYYAEISFTSEAGFLPAGGDSGEIHLRWNRADWSAYNELNDYSYNGQQNLMLKWPQLTLYRNGVLVWGTEPAGQAAPTPTRTNTPVPATATPTPTRTSTLAAATATPSRTPTRTSTPVAPTATPTSGLVVCSVNYAVQNDWGSGATVNVTIRNNGPTAINGWTLAWAFPGNQQVSQMWNATYTQSGQNVSASNLSWNALIPASGGTVNFGFNLSYSGVNSPPTAFVLNGMTCGTY